MPACTFFGHRECDAAVADRLKAVITEMIELYAVDCFYVGSQGRFDSIVQKVLTELMQQHHGIECTVVLAYMPAKHMESGLQTGIKTLLPEGIENVPRRFAIDWRNRWMLNHADYVVAYVNHSWGGAAKFAEMAARRGKMLINLGSMRS